MFSDNTKQREVTVNLTQGTLQNITSLFLHMNKKGADIADEFNDKFWSAVSQQQTKLVFNY